MACRSIGNTTICVSKRANWWIDLLYGYSLPSNSSFSSAQSFIVTEETDYLKLVNVTKHTAMKSDYSDLRFVINPNGTSNEKRYLPYYISDSDSFGATVWVAFPHNEPLPENGSEFYMLFGNPDSESMSNGYMTFNKAGHFFNNFSRTKWYDVHHSTNGYDVLISGNPAGEENHPACATDPVSGNLLIAYKEDDENVHPGAASTRVVYREGTVNSDETITWGTKETIFDPAGQNGAGNAVLSAINYNGVSRKICLCNYQVAGGGGDQSEIRIYMSIKDDNGSWSAPVNLSTLVNLDRVTFGGTQGIVTHDGIIFMACHSDNAPWAPTIFYSRDYGQTWSYVERSQESVSIQLNETAIIQLKDPSTGEWLNKIRCTSRNENDTLRNPFYDWEITWDSTTVNVSATRIGRFADTAKNRPFYLRMKNYPTDRIFCFYGTTRGKGVYSDDEGDTFHPIPYHIMDGIPYGSNRVYTIGWDLGNGKLPLAWVSNILAGGSDLFLQYFDGTLNALRNINVTTLTASRPRPLELSPNGLKFGVPEDGYLCSSSTSNTIPTTHPTQVTFTVPAGLSWQAGHTGVARRLSAAYFLFTVVSYSGTTLVVNSTSHVGSGTGTTWTINKLSNLITDQAFVSHWERNGRVKPFRLKARMRSADGASSIVGLKQIEARATAIVTVSNAGSAGDTIEIRWQYTAGAYLGNNPIIGKVASYTVQSGDNIAAVVDGLVQSANLIGICTVSASNSTTLTLRAPRGQGTNINGLPLTIVTTGSVVGSSGNFSGGATESVTTFNNDIVFTNATVGIEQANDGYSQTLALSLNNFHEYNLRWNDTIVEAESEGTTRTKTSANGSGVPNWEGAILIYCSTTNANPQVYVDSDYIYTYPENDTTATPGEVVSGQWNENENESGIV